MGNLRVDQLTPEVMAELRGYVEKYHARGGSGVFLESIDLAAIMFALPALVEAVESNSHCCAQAASAKTLADLKCPAVDLLRTKITALQEYNNQQVEARRAAEAKACELTEALAGQVDAYRELGERTERYKRSLGISKADVDVVLKLLEEKESEVHLMREADALAAKARPPKGTTPPKGTPAPPARRCCCCLRRRA